MDNFMNNLIVKPKKKIYESIYNNYKKGDKCIIDYDTFIKRFNNETNNIFLDFKWKNTFICGELISCLLEYKYNENMCNKSLINIIVHGTDQEEIKNNLFNIIKHIYKKIKDCYILYEIKKMHNSYTIVSPNFKRIIKITIKFNSSIINILKSYELSNLQVGFNGKSILYTNNYLKSIQTRNVFVTNETISLRKLIKSYKRGYNIVMNEMDKVLHNNNKICPISLEFSNLDLEKKIKIKEDKQKYIPSNNQTKESVIYELARHYSNKTLIKFCENNINLPFVNIIHLQYRSKL